MEPKKENEGKGFEYFITDEQIAAYQKWTLKERLDWLWNTTILIKSAQTEEEKRLVYKIKHKPIGLDANWD